MDWLLCCFGKEEKRPILYHAYDTGLAVLRCIIVCATGPAVNILCRNLMPCQHLVLY